MVENSPEDRASQPLEYEKAGDAGFRIRRLLVLIVWLIASAVIIAYLIRMFRSM